MVSLLVVTETHHKTNRTCIHVQNFNRAFTDTYSSVRRVRIRAKSILCVSSIRSLQVSRFGVESLSHYSTLEPSWSSLGRGTLCIFFFLVIFYITAANFLRLKYWHPRLRLGHSSTVNSLFNREFA